MRTNAQLYDLQEPFSDSAFIFLPMGGLGNQLFQYATAHTLAKSHGVRLVANLRRLQNSNFRKLELNTFASDFTALAPSTHAAKRTQDRFAVRFPHLMNRILSNFHAEVTWDFDPAVLSLQPGTRLFGFFQSWRYFDEFKYDIVQQVCSLTKPSTWYLSSVNELRDQNFIAVHVRRSDYDGRKARRLHGVLSPKYYRDALRSLDVDQTSELVLFSDGQLDQGFIRDAFSGYSVQYFPPQPDSDPIESLLLMSLGRKIICANSTFSWWAAYVGQHDIKEVAVPENWFANRPVRAADRFPPHWTIISKGL